MLYKYIIRYVLVTLVLSASCFREIYWYQTNPSVTSKTVTGLGRGPLGVEWGINCIYF